MTPRVSVVVPCRNEGGYIEPFVRSMLAQEPPAGSFEIIVADGESSDGTRELLCRLAAEHPSLRVIDNPARIVSAGLNRAIAAASGDVIIRADVHTEYEQDYVRECVRVLQESGADNVGGPWIVARGGYMASAIAAVFHSRLGSGGARAHDPDYEGLVDTVYLGCWRRTCFERYGLFDEALVRNQDDEFNLRVTRAGGRVWQSPAIKSRYHSRASLWRLFRQYVQYGYWKVRVIQKHRIPASVRHLVPALFVGMLLMLAGATPVSAVARLTLALVSGLYLACIVMASIAAAIPSNVRLLPVLPLVFAAFHLGYGGGFLRGLLDFVILRRGPAARMTVVTRQV